MKVTNSGSTRNMPGFSIIELLAVIFVIALLIAIIIPAVLMSREAARRAQCANNLRQLGLAIHSYNAAFGCLPAAHSGQGCSFIVSIMPYNEMNTLYESLNLSVAYDLYSPENITFVRTKIATLYCPSDGSFTSVATGGTNYCGNRGSGVQLFGYNGVFTYPRLGNVHLADITDGTAGTAMISEWLGAADEESVRTAKVGVFRTPKQQTKPSEFYQFIEACGRLDPSYAMLGAPSSKGTNWLFGESGFTLYNHSIPPNQNLALMARPFSKASGTPAAIIIGGLMSSSATDIYNTSKIRYSLNCGVGLAAEMAEKSRESKNDETNCPLSINFKQHALKSDTVPCYWQTIHITYSLKLRVRSVEAEAINATRTMFSAILLTSREMRP